MMVQVAKLAVLHEDIMLEIHGALSAADMNTLGHASEAYRRMYFVRRALATAFEMKQAVDVLQMNKAFKRMKKSWTPTSTRMWEEAVRFFSKNHVLISTWRNDVGAKFTEAAVEYALDENKDVVDVVDVYRPKQGPLDLNINLKIAHPILAAGMARGKAPDDDFEAHMRKVIDVVRQTQAYAVHVARIITFEILWKR